MIKQERGITLIALVVTIVVLLILAAVSIAMLGGENGIITQAQQSKEATEQAKVQEIVDLAINTLIAENNGSSDGITPKDVADRINVEYSQYENVYAEDIDNFPTKIVFPEENNRTVNVDLVGTLKDIYDGDLSEADIAPVDIFNYEIISDAETGATSLNSLPTKEARITGIKSEYCNGVVGDENTNYEIILEDGSKLDDTLVIPYQVEINGEMYKITEANIYIYGYNGNSGYSMPKIKTIIYPNTIKKIIGHLEVNSWENDSLQKVILSRNLKEIGDGAFYGCNSLENVDIPSGVTSIGEKAFYAGSSLTSIKIPNSVTSIGEKAFGYCDNLTSIEIPSSVISIENDAFTNCGSLTSIKIPNSITSIGEKIFFECTSLISIEIPSSVTSIERYAFYQCNSLKTVNYKGTMSQWQQISFNSGNNALTNAKIICTDGILNQ